MNLPFKLETTLEEKIAADPEWQEGAVWGKPRSGHPEGQVLQHIAEVLANVDRFAIDAEDRRALRIIALIHDTFKSRVKPLLPAVGENHHAMLARRFAERYIDDPALLDIIELHDAAYHCWRAGARWGNWAKAGEYADQLIARLGPSLPRYVRFFRADNRTGDKDQAPLAWFEDYVQQQGIQV
ncbi:MAG: HD domain-containing protein [Chloroflexota bacterium]